ncbi:General substrate transporter domain containing protein [Aphelenchoides besseyi]|nr:General substrate transporter domain containing protein [Aphelenchoides besseyi]
MVVQPQAVASKVPAGRGSRIGPQSLSDSKMTTKFHRVDDGTTSTATFWQKLRLFLTGCCCCAGSFNFGWSLSLINPLADVLQSFLQRSLERHLGFKLTSWNLNLLWPTVAGLVFVGSFLGALLTPRAIKLCGLNGTFVLSSTFICISLLMAAISEPTFSAELFILHRLLIGIGVGLATPVQSIYLSEISPIRYRGSMGTLTGFATSIGYVAASGIGLPTLLGKSHLWRWAYIIETVPSLIQMVSLACFLRQTPIRLLKAGYEKEALRSLQLFHTKTEALNQLEILEREVNSTKDENDDDSFASLWRESRSALIICVLLNCTVSFSGILAASFFGTLLLTNIGFSHTAAAYANFLASFSGLAGNFIGTFTVDKIGRRVLIIGCLSFLAFLNCALMILVFIFEYTEDVRTGYAFLVIFIIFLFVFSVGVGPLAWMLPSELSTLQYRARLQSISVSCQYFTCFLSSLIFLPLYRQVGSLSFLIFIVPLGLCSLFLFMQLPESKNRSINEIVDDLQRRSLSNKKATRVMSNNKQEA